MRQAGAMHRHRGWASILAHLATPVRVLVTLVLFSFSVASHGIAMGEGPMPVDTSMEMSMPMDQAPHHKDCRAAHCGAQAPPCCATGQCLIAVAPPSPLPFGPAARPVQVESAIMVLSSSLEDPPLRPPTLVSRYRPATSGS